MSDTSSGSGRGRMTYRGARGQMPRGYGLEQMPAAHNWGRMARDDRSQAEDGWQRNPVTGEWESVQVDGGPRPGPTPRSRKPDWDGTGAGTGEYTRGRRADAYPRASRGARSYAEPTPAGYESEYGSGPTPGAYDSEYRSEPMPEAYESYYDSEPTPAAYHSRPRAGRAHPARRARAEVRSSGGTSMAAVAARELARAGGSIITAASLAAAFCITFVITYGANSGNRASSGQANVLAPVTHLNTLARKYETIAAAANQQLAVDASKFTASENSNLAAARSALLAEVAVSRSFDGSLASWLTDWKQTYAAAKNAQLQAPFPVSIPYPSSVAATAQALIQADQAREGVLGHEASSMSLAQLQSFSGEDQTAGSALASQVAALRTVLRLPAQ
jgi:hypothetical protein